MEQPLGHVGIDVAGGLVRNEEVGPIDDGPGDGNALLLAARKGWRTGRNAIAETDPVDHLAHRSLNLRLLHAGDAKRKSNIVEDGEVADQTEILKHHPDAPSQGRQAVTGDIGKLLSEEANASTSWPPCEVKQLKERRLPGARRPGQETEAAGREAEIEIAKNLAPRTIAQPDAVKFGDVRQYDPSFPSTWPRPPCQAALIPQYRLIMVSEEGLTQ